MTQRALMLKLLKKNRDAIIIGSLGTISKDLEEIPHKHKILIRGAMGCVMGVGLGYALSSKKKVIVIVGEGSFLMKLGSIATINKYKPKNLKVIILNNGKYASCGGQKNNFIPNDSKHLNSRTYSVHKVS